MALNLGHPPEAFNKNIGTQAPLPESYFIGVSQRSDAADSRMFHGKWDSRMAQALVILECSRERTALKYYGCSVHWDTSQKCWHPNRLSQGEAETSGVPTNLQVQKIRPLTLKPWL